jgi:hypothetical protein
MLNKLISIIYIICLNLMIMVKSETITVTGSLFCGSNPLAYVNVKLMDEDGLIDELFGAVRSNINGEFTITGSASDLIGLPSPYLIIEYQYEGLEGSFKIQIGELGGIATDVTVPQAFAATINFGTLTFNNKYCNNYLSILAAVNDYYVRTNLALPLSLTVRVDFPSITLPISLNDVIRIPINLVNGLTHLDAIRELGHIIRQTFDNAGSYVHYLLDATQYVYSQLHSCGKITNFGFAFYEGWASFWVGDCTTTIGIDYTIEGNVASALRLLQLTCGTSDADMVNVLKSVSSGTGIHSFSEFNDQHDVLYNCQL